jgi:P4 family phage/plasmid primase-like protien
MPEPAAEHPPDERSGPGGNGTAPEVKDDLGHGAIDGADGAVGADGADLVAVQPFAVAAPVLKAAGWPPIPIMPAKGEGAKGTPLKGTTGWEGVDLDGVRLLESVQKFGHVNVAIRCPVGIVGLDVDHYDDKRGGDTLKEWAEDWGELPPTVISTSRDDGVSGIRWFRVPDDWIGVGGAESIELIQRHHRFALVWPSLHPKGRRYRWLDEDGADVGIPLVADLPWLPQAYLDGLEKTGGGSGNGQLAEVDQDDLDRVLTEGKPCLAVDRALMVYPKETKAGKACHDTMIKVQLQLMRLGEQGHRGVRESLESLHRGFELDRGDVRDTEKEWTDALVTGLEKVMANPTAEADRRCCPKVPTDDRFTDSRLAERVAEEVMADRFIWVAGLKWMAWDGRRWVLSEDATVREAVRQWVIERFEETIEAGKGTGRSIDKDEVQGWMSAQARYRLVAVCDLAAGIVLRRAYELDTHPDLLNTPAGVVDLRTGQVLPHDPALMMTQITSGSYRPGFTHPDWVQALKALRGAERRMFRNRVGQAITARQPSDDRVLVLQGGGENGKSAVTSHGLVPALGGYGRMVSVKLLQSSRGNDHPTEVADLRGRRLVLGEELTEHRAIDVGLLKRLQGTGRVTARSLYKDPIEFDLTHTMMCTTNYTPRVDETDHGTWRRLAMVRFPFTFRAPGEELTTPNDRRGDPGLRDRLKEGRGGRHDAIVTWAVEGAVAYFAQPDTALALTKRVKADTRAWQMEADRILGFWPRCWCRTTIRPSSRLSC